VVILTGASSGLGRQLAGGLHGAGGRLALVARRRERLQELEREFGETVLGIPADVTDDTAPEQIVQATPGRFGPIDGLVNNDGITNVTPALRESMTDFRRVIETNLVAPFALARAAAATMRHSGGGSIVNVSSIVGLIALTPLPEASYAAAKAGLIGLTRELATQGARYRIRVNAVAPGAFSTDMTGNVYEPAGNLGAHIQARVPLAREGHEGELNAIVQVLLHPATEYLTGQVIAVDGGYTAC